MVFWPSEVGQCEHSVGSRPPACRDTASARFPSRFRLLCRNVAALSGGWKKKKSRYVSIKARWPPQSRDPRGRDMVVWTSIENVGEFDPVPLDAQSICDLDSGFRSRGKTTQGPPFFFLPWPTDLDRGNLFRRIPWVVREVVVRSLYLIRWYREI